MQNPGHEDASADSSALPGNTPKLSDASAMTQSVEENTTGSKQEVCFGMVCISIWSAVNCPKSFHRSVMLRRGSLKTQGSFLTKPSQADRNAKIRSFD